MTGFSVKKMSRPDCYCVADKYDHELNNNNVYDTLDLYNGVHCKVIGQVDQVMYLEMFFDSENNMAARIVIVS